MQNIPQGDIEQKKRMIWVRFVFAGIAIAWIAYGYYQVVQEQQVVQDRMREQALQAEQRAEERTELIEASIQAEVEARLREQGIELQPAS